MNQRDQPVSINVFEQIDSICKEFRRQCKEGKQPRIEEFLDDTISQVARPTLFRNLLHIDIEYRRRSEQQPSSKEYIQRFPDYARLIRQAFLEDTMMSLQSLHSTPGGDQTAFFGGRVEQTGHDHLIDVPAANRLGDYLLIKEIGRGGFGIVYEAKHTRRGDHVALKTLPMHSALNSSPDESPDQRQQVGDRLARFKREFRALANMNHPNLVGLHTLENDGDAWFFTMDLIEGLDFLSYVRPDNQLEETRLRSTLPQLVAGVMALHNRNVVHRDLKPSNVMVDKNGQVVILDFGLVSELQDRTDQTVSFQSQHFAGTPLYAAPEQLSGQRTSATDWYSMGVMLYEALTGSAPFAGSLAEVFEKKRNENAPRLCGLDSLPNDLAVLTDGLLARDPQNRPDALAVTEMVSGQSASQSMEVAQTSGPLIGREPHLKILHDSLAALDQNGRAQCVFISGRSGEGKTALAEEFLESIRKARSHIVLSGRCYDRESVPFKALDSAIDSLATYLEKLPKEEAALVLPDDLSFLTQLFPVLQRVEVIARAKHVDVSAMDRTQVLHRGFMALRLLLQRIGQDKPVIIIADDLQWGDTDSAEGLLKVLGSDEFPCIMFVGTFRSDEAEESRFLQTWEKIRESDNIELPIQEIGLAPLTVDECTQLVIAQLNRDDALIRRRALEFAEKTGGNPYLLTELIGCYDAQTDSFEALSLPEVVHRKLDRLPAEAKPLLEAISIAGKAISLDEAFHAAGCDSIAAGIVTHMRSENLVRLIGAAEDGLVDTYHDKIRETILDSMPKDKKQQAHLAMAQAIEHYEGIDPYKVIDSLKRSIDVDLKVSHRAADLAYQYHAAAVELSALAYSMLAAQQAKRQFALDVSIDNYEIAHCHWNAADNNLRFRIALGYGEALMLAGRFGDAHTILDGTSDLVNEALSKARIKTLQAEVTYKQQKLASSIKGYSDVLRTLGERIPESSSGFALSFLREVVLQCFFTLAPKWLYARRGPPDEKTVLKVSVFHLMGYVYYWRNSRRHWWCWLACLNRASRYPKSPQMAMGQVTHGLALMIFTRWRSRGNWYAMQGLRMTQAADNTTFEGTVHRGLGHGKLVVGELPDSLDHFDQASHIFTKRVPDFWQLKITQIWHAHAQLQVGNFSECQRLATQVFQDAVQIGQDTLSHAALALWARATGYNLPFEELRGCFQEVPEAYTSTIQLLVTESHWHLVHHRITEAVATAEQAVERMYRYGVFNKDTASAVSSLVHMLRAQSMALERDDPTRSIRCRKRALKVARRALGLTRTFQLDRPAALREYALTLAQFGRLRKALKYSQRSCFVAQQQSARHEYAQSLLVCGRIGEKLKLPEAKQQIEKAETQLAEFEKPLREATIESFGTAHSSPA